MNLGDKRLEEGYEKNIEEILSNLDITMDELRASDLPVKVRGDVYKRQVILLYGAVLQTAQKTSCFQNAMMAMSRL